MSYLLVAVHDGCEPGRYAAFEISPQPDERLRTPFGPCVSAHAESLSVPLRKQVTGVLDMASVAKQAKQHGSNQADETLGHLTSVADRMHALLVERADVLIGCLKGSPEEGELRSIVAAIESYEAKRWPLGKVPGGKG